MGKKKIYKTFCNYDDPYTGVVTSINITKLVTFVKKTNNSFYGSMLYYVLMSMYNIDAFKYGYGKDENGILHVYKYDELAATITVLNLKGELNFSRYIRYNLDYKQFINEFILAKKDAEMNMDYFKILNQDNMNKIQFTCLPWIRFNNFKDVIEKNEKSSKPKICWGQYYEINNEFFIDFSILVNHAFQDGIHMAMLVNEIQNNISKIDFKFQERVLKK